MTSGTTTPVERAVSKSSSGDKSVLRAPGFLRQAPQKRLYAGKKRSEDAITAAATTAETLSSRPIFFALLPLRTAEAPPRETSYESA